MTARPLPGTEYASLPFWSPDSRYLGFLADNGMTLKKLDPSGGPPISLCDLPFAGLGGSWNQFGTIIAGTQGGPIYRVSDQGGKATAVTAIDPRRNERARSFPQFLPDGRHFLFFVVGTNEVAVGATDGTQRATVMRDGSAASYATGYLLFPREGTLIAQRFDPSTFQLSGEPIAAADRVYWATALRKASFTTSANGVLAYAGSCHVADVSAPRRRS